MLGANYMPKQDHQWWATTRGEKNCSEKPSGILHSAPGCSERNQEAHAYVKTVWKNTLRPRLLLTKSKSSCMYENCVEKHTLPQAAPDEIEELMHV